MPSALALGIPLKPAGAAVDPEVLKRVAELEPFHLVHKSFDIDALDRVIRLGDQALGRGWHWYRLTCHRPPGSRLLDRACRRRPSRRTAR